MIISGAGFCYCCKILCCNHAKSTGFVIEPKDVAQQVIQVPYSPQQLQIHQYPNQKQKHQPNQEKSIQTETYSNLEQKLILRGNKVICV